MKEGRIIKDSRHILTFSSFCLSPVSHRKWSSENSSQTPPTPSRWLHTPPRGMEPGANLNWWWPKGQVSTREKWSVSWFGIPNLCLSFSQLQMQWFCVQSRPIVSTKSPSLSGFSLKGASFTTTPHLNDPNLFGKSDVEMTPDIWLSALGAVFNICLMIRLLLQKCMFLSFEWYHWCLQRVPFRLVFGFRNSSASWGNVCFYQTSVYHLNHVQRTIHRFLEIKEMVWGTWRFFRQIMTAWKSLLGCWFEA